MSWAEACPLEGVCSECGLGVRWAEVLNPSLTVPTWSFEHAPAGRKTRRLFTTWLVALWPPRFWRAIRLEHPLAMRRLWVLLGASVLSAHVIVWAASAGTAYWAVLNAGPWVVVHKHPLLSAVFANFMYRLPPMPGAMRTGWFFHGNGLFGWVDLFLLLWLAGAPATFLLLGESMRRVKVRRAHLFRAFVYTCAALPPLALLSMGLRAGIFFEVWGLGWRGTAFGGLRTAAEWGPVSIWAVGAAWIVLCWAVIPRLYLRLPHAGAVSGLMLVTSALASAVVCTLLLLAISA
jgi:hypothetical protein